MSARLILATVLAINTLLASPITLTFSGTATGNLAGTEFTNAPYVLTSTGDTDSVIETFAQCMPSNPACPIFTLPVASSQIAIQGLPVAVFTDPTAWTDPNFSGDIIFEDAGSRILGITVLFEGLENYNLQSSFGPVFSSIDFETQFFHAFQNIPTTQGTLSLVAMNETFVAVVTPEPASSTLAILGMIFLWLCSIRARRWAR
jgi:hypothetical protein